jgi:hypothetical protein
MFGEVDSSNEEDVKKAAKKHKVHGKGKAKAKKKGTKKKHHARKKIAVKA